MKTIIFIILLLSSTNLLAATYYVKDDGNDSSDGLSDTNAWASLHKASTATSNSDKILLKCDDTWTVTVNARSSCAVGIGLVFGGSGGAMPCTGSTPTQNITIGAYYGSGTEGVSGSKPIIDASAQTDSSSSNVNTPEYTPLTIGGYGQACNGGFTVQNLDMRGPNDGPVVMLRYGGDGNALDDCTITGPGWADESLVIVDGDDHTITDNVFDSYSNSTSDYYGKNIEFFGGSGHTISGNTFRGYGPGGGVRFSNNGTGATIEKNYFYDPDTDATDCWAMVIRSCNGGSYIIRNNVFDLTNNGTLSGSNLRGVAIWDDHTATTRKFINNTFISDGVGYALHGDQSGNSNATYLYNNIFYDLEDVYKDMSGACPDTQAARQNITYSTPSWSCARDTEVGTSTSDPNLKNNSMSNRQADDADLTSSSTAAIDSGYASDGDTPSDDYAGISRSTIDIGAFEYVNPIGQRTMGSGVSQH